MEKKLGDKFSGFSPFHFYSSNRGPEERTYGTTTKLLVGTMTLT